MKAKNLLSGWFVITILLGELLPSGECRSTTGCLGKMR